ncbi:MAG TPA: cytochrome C oxidase subunit IV family protein [bacterium]|nr:cytochrome C oxidase subunit IV family protein [bacterium]
MSAPSTARHSHTIPLRVYLTVAALLLVMTAVTIAVSFVHLGALNIVVALAIAGFKALLVAFFFMHLYYDNKFYFMVFAIALLFLVIFIGFTMIDTTRRADLYPEVGRPIQVPASIYNRPADSAAAHPADSAADTTAPATH